MDPLDYVAAWPVTDEDMTYRELRREGEHELALKMLARGLTAVGDVVWELRDDVLWPDAPEGTLLLVARVPAAQADWAARDEMEARAEWLRRLDADRANSRSSGLRPRPGSSSPSTPLHLVATSPPAGTRTAGIFIPAFCPPASTRASGSGPA